VREPAWLWIGGALSVFIVLAITVGPPRIGTTATIGIVVAGNLAMGAVIDRFGLFGLDRIALSWPRVLGLVLLAVGAALSLHKG
jgi:transporter family-2 protein